MVSVDLLPITVRDYAFVLAVAARSLRGSVSV
jgi:hypothetical protein